MRMSRRMGLLGNMKMNPSEVVVSEGSRLNYWASTSQTDDKWHRTSPYTGETAYFGRNSNGVDHIAAVCFTTGDFSGKSKQVKIEIHATSKWGFENALVCGWAISKHNWSPAAEWAAGSKEHYSEILYQTIPDDPNAVASGIFDLANRSSEWFSISADVALHGNTQYVLYIWRYGKASDGMLVGISQPRNFEPVITITG